MLERYSLREMADHHGQLYDRLLENFPRRREPELRPVDAPISFHSRPSRGTPRVSVITPCFNHGRWLRECVQSVRDQTYPAVETIVVDDGSTEEDTKGYLAELDESGDVTVIRMERNSGPSAARNRGIQQATGRYILPVDADNLLLPDAIERLVSQLQGAGEDVGFIYPTIQYFGNREDYFEPPAFNGWLLTKGNYIDTCALIDREVFDAGIEYPEDIVLGHEDWDFFLTLLERGVHGESARGKSLRYRKSGFTRSDVVDWSLGRFHGEVPARHEALFPIEGDLRGDNPHVELKARWAPALAVIVLAPIRVDSPDWLRVLAGLRTQQLRDFELLIPTDSVPDLPDHVPPVRSLPSSLAERPGELLGYAMQQTAAPHVAVTYGTGAELLSDPGSLERLVRILELGASSGVIGFCDAGQAGRFPWCVLPGSGPLEPHTLCWSRRHKPLREWPDSLDRGDPLGDLGRWYQLRRISVDWRHLPRISAREAPSPTGRAVVRGYPRSRPEISDRHSRIDAETSLPGALQRVPRWNHLSQYAAPCAMPLFRHRRSGADEWKVTRSMLSPEYFELDRCLGLVYWMAFEGTARITEDPEHGWVATGRGTEPDAVELERTLGYADQVAFPLLEPLMLCRHERSGRPVLVCGADDPVRPEVEWPQLAVLGWIDRWPVNPLEVPRSGESTAWLRGLVRTIDYGARCHRVGLGLDPGGDRHWELGALLDRDPGGGIPAWVDDAGRLHAGNYDPGRYPFSPKKIAKWVAAPAGWRGFGRPAPRVRAVARRGYDAALQTVGSHRAPSAPSAPTDPQAWLLPDDGPHRVAIYAALHAATSDQLITRDPSEARELGYESIRHLGYALAVAPLTGSLQRPEIGVPWGSRFGQALSHIEDPLNGRI
jgi:hypothetical protein